MKSLNYLKICLALTNISVLGLATFQTVHAAPSAPLPTEQCPRSENMVGWWQFDEVVGLNAVDKSGNNNNGTYLNGLIPTPPPNNGVLKFDGKDDYVSVKSAPSLNLGESNFSVCFNIKTSSTGLEVILDKRVEASGPVQGWVVFTDNGGKLALQLSSGTGGFRDYRSNAFIGDNKWHQVLLSVERNKTDGGKWYVDGILQDTFNPTGIPGNLSNTIPLTIGRRSDSSNPGFFNGRLDEVKIFNRAL